MSPFLNNREQKIFVACLTVVLIVVFYNGLVLPLRKEMNLLHQEITVEKKQLDRSLAVIQKAESLRGRYDGYLKRFGKAGSREEAASSILSEIEKVTGQLGLFVTELKPQQVRTGDFDDRFSVHLTLNSGLVDVVRFLYTLQQVPYLFDVEEVEFKNSAERGQGTITTNLVLGKTFILTDPNERAGGQKGKRVPL